jgi:aspartyl-tRNA(Asn)/glutamyl-tRNA(Gln) amidotransferase subunit A
MIDLKQLTIFSAHRHLSNGDFTAQELTDAHLAEIERKNKDLNAYLEVFDDARAQAKEADKRLHNLKISKSQHIPALLGIPIALKDNILVKGKRVSASSKILTGYVAPYDSAVVAKLKAQGAVIMGRTNMDEFAMGSSTETSAFGTSHNPHDVRRVPGGSSGGAAAAVAANLALAALGTDTGGSVRQPASLCGIAGLKPTYGSISRHGIIAMGSSLDIIGPLTKTVKDSELLFDAIQGRDSLDATSVNIDAKSHRLSAKGVTIGIPRNFLEMKGLDADVLANFNSSVNKLTRLGYAVKDISLPTIPHSLAVYHIVMPAELSTNLSRYDSVKYGLHRDGATLLGDYVRTRTEGFGREAHRRILLGAYVLSSGYYDAYYRKATSVRACIEKEFADAFKQVDCIATPTTPTPAFKIGEKTKDPLAMYLADIFTVPANIGAIPALSMPSGFAERDGARLPLGFQLMAAYGNDRLLFEVGKQFETV